MPILRSALVLGGAAALTLSLATPGTAAPVPDGHRPATVAVASTARTAVPAATRGIVIRATRVGSYGTVLTDGRGMPLYLFTRDRGSTSRCYGDCAQAWPVTYAKGKPRAGTGVSARLLGTTKRSDGRLQVTYRGHPLYYYEHDRPRVALCHDVREFGGLWLLVKPNGRPLP